MSDLTFVQNDTAPSLFGTLTRADGSVYDLTDTTVRLQMRLAIDRRFFVDAPAVIVEAAAGRVRFADCVPFHTAALGKAESSLSRGR